ncbi:MAG: DUF2948 family protein [Alphaproteobacteria bacterium]|nr:DUF2948 family protein [Alphaproteobacteria bacterium]
MARPPALTRSDQPLRVRAEDAEDITIVSAYLQDALVPVSEIAFDQADSRFAMVVGRFRWEAMPEGETPGDGTPYERVHCGVRFERVTAVKTRGVDRGDRGRMLNLLQVAAGDGFVELIFADDATIRLDVTALSCHVEDLGEPWPTVFRPSHDATVGDEGG